MAWTRDTLDRLPRLGWAEAPTPVTEVPALAEQIGVDWFGVKRDDLVTDLSGATKVRKLDFVLAAPRYAEAKVWASFGAIGSGSLACLTQAASALERSVLACCFWEPPAPDVMGNLACIASGPTTIRYGQGRVGMALRYPALVLGGRLKGAPVVPPGASSGEGVVGCVRGGLELAEQIRGGALPRPDRIYVPWGTGGTAVGLAMGLAMAGEPIPVIAVATVERPFATRSQLRALVKSAARLLSPLGTLPPGALRPDVQLVHGHVGKGYGHPTPASLGACADLAEHGLGLEPVYGGKAVSALRGLESGRGGRVLYWLTSHRGDLPTVDGWRDRLPPALTRDLARAAKGRGPSRRRLLVGATAAAGVLAVGRTTGYGGGAPAGRVLAGWEAQVIAAAAEAVLPDEAGPLPADGPTAWEVAANVDRYLSGMPKRMTLEVHGMMGFLEQGTVIGGGLRRLTNLRPPARRRFLETLSSLGGLPAQASRGVRDLCYLGWYQDPRTWELLGYRGPLVPRRDPGAAAPRGKYDALVAPEGQLPGAAT